LNCLSLPQLHWPSYNYLGSGTKLEKDYKPINKLDEAARDHDYFYKNHKDTKTRHILLIISFNISGPPLCRH